MTLVDLVLSGADFVLKQDTIVVGRGEALGSGGFNEKLCVETGNGYGCGSSVGLGNVSVFLRRWIDLLLAHSTWRITREKMTRIERLLKTLPQVTTTIPGDTSIDIPSDKYVSTCLTTTVTTPWKENDKEVWSWETTLLKLSIEEDVDEFLTKTEVLLRASFLAQYEGKDAITYKLTKRFSASPWTKEIASYVSHPKGSGLDALAWAAEDASKLVRGWELPPELELRRLVPEQEYERALFYLNDGASVLGAAEAAIGIAEEYRNDPKITETEAIRRTVLRLCSCMDVGSPRHIEGLRTLLKYADARVP